MNKKLKFNGCVVAKKIAKKAVAQAQQWERKRLGEKVNTGGQKSVFKMAKERQNMVGVNCLKDESANIVVKPEMIKNR